MCVSTDNQISNYVCWDKLNYSPISPRNNGIRISESRQLKKLANQSRRNSSAASKLPFHKAACSQVRTRQSLDGERLIDSLQLLLGHRQQYKLLPEI
jgi:hypothetical protein